ncbi:MAG: type II secretion system protein [Gemmatimonadales bacterium]|nr:type II secretion system protein [Gemmatimonadales bacterium]
MNRRGLTLLETMIALVILSTIGVAFLGLFTQTTRTANDLEAWSTAVSYAESGMELAVVAVGTALPSSEQLPNGFTRTTTLQSWTGATSLLTVTVAFPDGRTFALRRLVASGP